MENNHFTYQGKEHQKELGLNWHDFGFRNYDASLGRWMNIDPLADVEHSLSLTPYHFAANNPISNVDPDGLDWYDVNGTITWHNQEGELTIEDQTYQSLGKNVLVGTHNRDEDGNEDLNSASFSLYLESNTEGASATIEGNTVPADTEEYGTLAEGIYPARISKYKGDDAILINEGGELPTVNGNPNNKKNYNKDGTLKPTEEHVIDEVFFHKGNYARESLSTSQGKPISEGCQTGPCGQGSLPRFRSFMKKAKGFKGKYYLRQKKKTKK